MSSEKPFVFQRWAAWATASPVFWIVMISVLFAWPTVRAIRAQDDLPPPLPELGLVADFVMVDHLGKQFGSSDLGGVVWVAQFLDTEDAGGASEEMVEIQHRSRGLGQAFHLVSFTVAPERDTMAVLAEYAVSQRASKRAWSFLTNSPNEVETALRASFGIELDSVQRSRLILIDQYMQIRGTYDIAEDMAVNRLLRDAGLLVNRGF